MVSWRSFSTNEAPRPRLFSPWTDRLMDRVVRHAPPHPQIPVPGTAASRVPAAERRKNVEARLEYTRFPLPSATGCRCRVGGFPNEDEQDPIPRT